MQNLKAQKKLERIHHLNFSLLPTPIHKLNNLSRLLNINLYCKRDDMTGFAFGGNKTRKLDYLIADALEKGFDTIIAVGANQSNFCRMASAAGVVTGLEVHLVLGGEEPKKPTGNLLLMHLTGSTIHHIDSETWDDWVSESKNLKKKLEDSGKKVYLLPVGGSTPIGALGYVKAFKEIVEFEGTNKIDFNYIFHSTSSAGTQAGLVIGKIISDWPGKVIGIAAAMDKKILEKEIFELSLATGELLDIKVNKDDVIVDDRYIGEKYAARTKGCEEAIELFFKNEGILLDYVYTGKAASGVIDYARTGKFNNADNILFIHTGGNIELFE